MLIGLKGDRPVRVGFIGFHPNFNPVWNHITHSLIHRFALDVSEPESKSGPPSYLTTVPDFLFYSVFDALHKDRRYDRCVKVFTCEENFGAPWGECRYAMTSDYSPNPRHLRLPIYVRALRHVQDQPCYPSLRDPDPVLVKDPTTDWQSVLANKTKFCAFVCSNEGWRDPRSRGECGLALRTRFFDLLFKYKRVDSGGSVRNNLGYRVKDKLPFLQDYKFTVAFENSSYPGYVSEKLAEPMFVRSVPVYWGSPEVDDDFNPKSMVVATGRRLEDVVDEVAALDRDDAAYRAKLREPWFHGNVQNRYCSVNYLADFLAKVFSGRIP